MTRLLAFPFQLTPAGTIGTVDQDSDAATEQLLQCLLQTRPDDRPLLPGFGIGDPVNRTIERTEVTAAVAAYGPPVDVRSVTVTPGPQPGTARITVEYT